MIEIRLIPVGGMEEQIEHGIKNSAFHVVTVKQRRGDNETAGGCRGVFVRVSRWSQFPTTVVFSFSVLNFNNNIKNIYINIYFLLYCSCHSLPVSKHESLPCQDCF